MQSYAIGTAAIIPSGANPTPIQFAVLRDLSLDIAAEEKELNGQYQVGIDAFRGKVKFSGKAKYAWINGALLMAALPGATSATGTSQPAVNEAGVIPSTPFQITVSQSATFAENLGVRDLNTGKDLTVVASAPTTGQYSVAAGVYTFAAADVGHTVQISYRYTSASIGKTISFSNQVMGPGASYIVQGFSAATGAKTAGFKMYAARIPKLSVALKAEDWMENDIEFFAIQDPTTAKVIDLYVGE